ncbi:MAG: hypothetical protein FWE61_01190, partial [Micrococcales bacterium]|nr:hypothetical protein [Micrococcales bacterium]
MGDRDPDRRSPPLLGDGAEPAAHPVTSRLSLVVTDDDQMSIRREAQTFDEMLAADMQAELEAEQVTAERLALLARVSDAVTEHLDYRRAADALADIAIPPLAEWGFVALLDERGGFEHLRIATTHPGRAHVARTLEKLDHTWLARSETIREAVHAAPEDVLMPRAMDAARLAQAVSAEHYDLLATLGLGTWMIV